MVLQQLWGDIALEAEIPQGVPLDLHEVEIKRETERGALVLAGAQVKQRHRLKRKIILWNMASRVASSSSSSSSVQPPQKQVVDKKEATVTTGCGHAGLSYASVLNPKAASEPSPMTTAPSSTPATSSGTGN